MNGKRYKKNRWLIAFGLTKQEFDLLPMIAGGRSAREMSAVFKKKDRIIEKLRCSIYAKLGVQNQVMARAKIMREGLIRARDNRCPTCGRAHDEGFSEQIFSR
jgi:DNA-binding CsgD family transcriptional regulator